MHYKKICNISLLLTTMLVFMIWKWVDKIDKSTINVDTSIYEIIHLLLSFVFAYGFFHFLVSLTVFLIKHSIFVKKIILGPSYIEGTWIGYYFAADDDEPVVFYQIIEQSIDHIHILSQCYHIDKTYRCVFYSVGEVSIDPSNSALYYLYDVDRLNLSTQRRGVVVSKIQFEKRCFFKTPCKMNGYSFYSCAPKKQRMVQIKYSDDILVNLKHHHRDSKTNIQKISKQTEELIQEALIFYIADSGVTNKLRTKRSQVQKICSFLQSLFQKAFKLLTGC